MVTHKEALTIISDTVADDPDFPDEMSFLTHEADTEGADAGVRVPVTEVYAGSVQRDDPSNSNLFDYIENDDGERVGYVFETKWEMDMFLDIWTAAGSSYDVDALGKEMKSILYTYDTRGPDKMFTDADNEPVPSIYDFSLGSGERNDSFVQTPSIRKWSQSATVRGAEQLTLPADSPVIKQTDITTE